MTDSEAMLISVDEMKSCEYVLVVHVGSLCTLKPYRLVELVKSYNKTRERLLSNIQFFFVLQ